MNYLYYQKSRLSNWKNNNNNNNTSDLATNNLNIALSELPIPMGEALWF